MTAGAVPGDATSVFDDAGVRHAITGAGWTGGEGTVHPLDSPGLVAKIYHPRRITPELAAKVQSMVRRPPRDPTWESSRHRSIAWPTRLLYADPGRRQFCGFLMPRVDTGRFAQAHAYYDPEDRIRRFGGGFTWAHLMTAAHNLASAVASVHDGGHRVGDLRETNVLVAPTALVTLIDCDSFEVRDDAAGRVYPTRVGSGEYLPPELQGIDFVAQTPDRYHADLFALAVMVFRFLMLGVHPFQARGARVEAATSTEAKIALGVFPYTSRSRSISPPSYAPRWDVLPRGLRAMFVRAFVDGHGEPEARPSAQEWVTTLHEHASRLGRCERNEHHRHAGRSCPWCAMRAATGSDPFPTPGQLGAQLEIDEPARGPEAAERLEMVRSHARVAVADDSLSQARLDALHDLGDRLGLRRRDVDRVVDDEIRRRSHARATSNSAPPPRRPSTRPERSGASQGSGLRAAIAGVRSRVPAAWRIPLPAKWRIVVPATIAVGAAGALAPLAAQMVLVLLLVPMLSGLPPRRRGVAGAAASLARAGRALPLATAHAATVAVPAGAAASGLVWLVARLGLAGSSLPWSLARLLAAAGAVLVAAYLTMIVPARRDGWYPRAAADGLTFVAGALAGASGRLTRAGFALWIVAAVLLAGTVMLPATWWPVR